MFEGLVIPGAGEARAAESRMIGIEYHRIAARIRHAEPVVVARHRGRVEDADERRMAVLLPQECEHAFIRVVQVGPAETARIAIAGVQLRMLAVELRELAVEILQAA